MCLLLSATEMNNEDLGLFLTAHSRLTKNRYTKGEAFGTLERQFESARELALLTERKEDEAANLREQFIRLAALAFYCAEKI